MGVIRENVERFMQQAENEINGMKSVKILLEKVIVARDLDVKFILNFLLVLVN